MKTLDTGTWGRVAWGVLAVLLLLLVFGVWTYSRPDLRPLPGESVVLMQTESLLEDFDLAYERLDFDRVLLGLGEPSDLHLTSGSDGRRVTFDRPFPYALWLAPFVAWRPETGFAVANALLLAMAAGFLAWSASRRSGAFAPAWVAALVFATPAFVSVFRADGTAYVFAVLLAAAGFVVLSGEVTGNEYRQPSARHALVAGVCLALAAAWQPLLLVLPLAFLPVWRRGDQRASMLLGFALGTVPQVLVQWWAGGGLHYFGAARFRFTPATGFPHVDFSPLEWNETVQRLSALHFDGAPELSWGFDGLLWLWNSLFLLVGRHLGLLPYAAVVLVTFLVLDDRDRNDRPRGLWGWCAAVLLVALAALTLHPFRLFDGASLGPSHLLPLLALAPMVLVTQRIGALAPGRARLGLAVCVAASAAFLLPLWTAPRATGAEALQPSAAARAVLPYETSQQLLPGGPWDDIAGLRVRFLDEHGWGESRRDRLVMETGHPGRLLIASAEPVEALSLDFGPEASSQLRVEGGDLGELMLRPSGGVGFELELDQGRRHAMWWSPQPRWLYPLTLRFDAEDSVLDIRLDSERRSDKLSDSTSRLLPFRLGVLESAPATDAANDD